ncbi:MAG TPA: hypothetical protein VNY33_04375 [Gaiellaceae bacterium]|nr:hypothetical protein [Gaiellaceae bacterium]
MRRSKRIQLGLATVAIVATVVGAGSAFTASNTVPGASLGQGSNTISGYTISNEAHTINAANPLNVDAVTFTITPSTATTVKAQLVSGGSWYACTNTTGSVSCATTAPQATTLSANALNVMASQ